MFFSLIILVTMYQDFHNSHDCPSSDGDELSESDDEEPSNNSYEFSNSATLKEDHMTYERLYNWLY